MLAFVAPRRIEVSAVTDRRMDMSRIGYKPKNRANIVPDRPVTDIVREALAVELNTNGHSVVADTKDAGLVAAVEEFWLDVVVGYSTTPYGGQVAIGLAVACRRRGG